MKRIFSRLAAFGITVTQLFSGTAHLPAGTVIAAGTIGYSVTDNGIVLSNNVINNNASSLTEEDTDVIMDSNTISEDATDCTETEDVMATYCKYNRNATLSYCRLHYNDGNGLCAEFVSDAIDAGGLDSWSRSATDLHRQLQEEEGFQAVEETCTFTGGYFYKSDCSLNLQPGDLIFYDCGAYEIHVVVFNGWDSQGRMKAYAHNKAWDGSAFPYNSTCWDCGAPMKTLTAFHILDDDYVDPNPEQVIVTDYVACLDDVKVEGEYIIAEGWVVTDPCTHPEAHGYICTPDGEKIKGYSGFICNQYRPDVGSAFNTSDNCGFQIKIPIKDLRSGTYSFEVYVILDEFGYTYNPMVNDDVELITIPEPTIYVTDVTMNIKSATLPVGQSETLVATTKPDNATTKSVTWSSSNPSIATVKDGVVTGVSKGTAIIKATADDKSNKSASCVITVEEKKILVKKIIADDAITMIDGESYTLKTSVLPDDSSIKTLSFASSNPASVTIDSSGILKAVAPGVSVITISATDNSGVCATCVVTVKKKISTCL